MKNLMDILSDAGIEVPEEKVSDLNKALNENYKTVAEFDKRTKRLETERDGYKEQLDAATESLKGFEGIDAEALKAQLAEAQKKAEDAEKDYLAKLAARDFDDTLKTEMAAYKFTSKAAEKSIMEQVKNAGLQCVNGKIMGLNDLIETLKESDADAFAKEDEGGEEGKAKFTARMNNSGSKKYSDRDEIMKIKDTRERQEAIKANMDLFT